MCILRTPNDFYVRTCIIKTCIYKHMVVVLVDNVAYMCYLVYMVFMNRVVNAIITRIRNINYHD